MKHKQITVASTPNGLADAVTDNYFVLPHTEKMAFDKAIELFSKCNSIQSNYIQSQDNNLNGEFSELILDAGRSVEWADQVFGKACIFFDFTNIVCIS